MPGPRDSETFSAGCFRPSDDARRFHSGPRYNLSMRHTPKFFSLLIVLFLASCATAPANPYPPFNGRWLYDYAASVETAATLPANFQESISRLDREGRTDEHKMLESIAMNLQPPEILRIEYMASTMVIRGGNAFKRDYDLSNLNPTPGVEVKWDMVKLESKLTDQSIEMSEKYELSPDRNRLIITISMKTASLEKPLEMQWIYMSASAF